MKIFVILAMALLSMAATLVAADRPNVLFIPVDDLNHWVGHLGRNRQTKTPNLDRLARMGVTFTNAHCAAPICNPSRTALLSGLRPSTTGIYDNDAPFANGAGVSADGSLVMQFKKAGYKTLGMGKLWHGGSAFPSSGRRPAEKSAADSAKLQDRSIGGLRFGIVEGGDEAVPDTAIADYAIAELARSTTQPFFLGRRFSQAAHALERPAEILRHASARGIQLPPTCRTISTTPAGRA